MEAEHLGQVIQRQLITNEFLIGGEISFRWDEVFATFDEFMLWFEHLWIVEIFQNDVDAHSVVRIRNTATIVCFGNHVSESIIWNDFVAIQEHGELHL